MTHTCNPSVWEVEAEGEKFKASLGHMKSCLKKIKGNIFLGFKHFIFFLDTACSTVLWEVNQKEKKLNSFSWRPLSFLIWNIINEIIQFPHQIQEKKCSREHLHISDNCTQLLLIIMSPDLPGYHSNRPPEVTRMDNNFWKLFKLCLLSGKNLWVALFLPGTVSRVQSSNTPEKITCIYIQCKFSKTLFFVVFFSETGSYCNSLGWPELHGQVGLE